MTSPAVRRQSSQCKVSKGEQSYCSCVSLDAHAETTQHVMASTWLYVASWNSWRYCWTRFLSSQLDFSEKIYGVWLDGCSDSVVILGTFKSRNSLSGVIS